MHTPEEVRRLALEEAARRLTDPDLREKVPASVLAKLLSELRSQQQVSTGSRDVLDVIRSSELSPAKKRTLIEAEVVRLESKIVELKGELSG